MKRIITVFLTFAIVVSMTGCSSQFANDLKNTVSREAAEALTEVSEEVKKEIEKEVQKTTNNVLNEISSTINKNAGEVIPEISIKDAVDAGKEVIDNGKDALNLGHCEPELTDEFTPNPELTDWMDVVFVDVGQGDSSFIITPNKDVILIDAGVETDAAEIIDAMNEYEFENIDLMIITHPHADHIGGAASIMKTFDVEEVLMSSYVATSKTFERMLNTIESQNIKVTQAFVGQKYKIDGVEIEILAVDTDKDDCNNSSIVNTVKFGTTVFMFTGDAEEVVEKEILETYKIRYVNILKAGHHGSSTSTSETFLDVIFPEYVIVSYGEGNSYGHPHKEFIELMEKYERPFFTTAEYGNITVRTNGEDIMMTGERE